MVEWISYTSLYPTSVLLMKKFKIWALFGLVTNTILFIRGIAMLFPETDSSAMLISITLSICATSISILGLFASLKILQKKQIGFDIAKKQVWGYFFVDIATVLFISQLLNAGPRPVVLTIIFTGIFCSQLAKLFNSVEAQEYCRN